MSALTTPPAGAHPESEHQWLKLAEAASVYEVSIDTLRRRIRTGELGRSVRVAGSSG